MYQCSSDILIFKIRKWNVAIIAYIILGLSYQRHLSIYHHWWSLLWEVSLVLTCCKWSSLNFLHIVSGYNELTGYTRSLLLYSEENSRWEIWDIFENKLYVTFNSTSQLPIGVHYWQFVEAERCTDEGTDLNFRE